nr:MAG TPA: hypothetical protein [Caudoviricetes sp.]
MLAPYFFCQRKIKGYRNPIRRSVPYFFSRVVAQDSPGATIRIWECSFTCKEIERSESRLRAFIKAC